MKISNELTEALDRIGHGDHSVTSEYLIFGPPGTGKTTSLTQQIGRALNRFGNNSVLAMSFSRAAAAELVGRDTSLDSDQIGTLHSRCFRALGKPQIAEVHVQEWNRENPRWRITRTPAHTKLDGEDSPEEFGGGPNDGDSLLQHLNRCRGMMIPAESWPVTVREFASRWDRYKRANQLLDFCGLIEICLRDVSVAPTNPAVIVVDEVQDLNRLQLALIRSWGRRANYSIVAGDDDQTIFSWAGASPDAILDGDIPENHKFFLEQSVRVPRRVHELAEGLIRQVGKRQPKTYRPRPNDGEVHRLSQAGYRSPEYWILKTAERHIEQGKSIMFLASCSFMLRPIIAVLRKHAIPFHNPYRKSNGFWNPLRTGSRDSAASRIQALLVAHPDFGANRRRWRCRDLASWSEWLGGNGAIETERMARISTLTTQSDVTLEILTTVLGTGVVASLMEALSGDPRALLAWWCARIAPEFRARVHFPADIARLRGPQALEVAPRVVVGTIHSVKGGQADVVYLFPDLSPAGDAQYRRNGAPRDSVIRTFYVGATRARETLYICSAEGAMAASI